MDYSKYVEILKEAKKEISADDLVNALAEATTEATTKVIGKDPLLSFALILFAKEISHEAMRNLFPELEERLKAVKGRDAEDE